jgi:hypothetical protein
MNDQPSTTKNNGRGTNLPSWTVPAIVVAVIVGLIAIGRKKRGVVENPLVDLVIITVGVFAFAAVFRVIGIKFGNPGFASFFGASTPPATTAIQ